MEDMRDMSVGSPNFVKVDPPSMQDDYDPEKVKEAQVIRPQVFDFNLVSQDNDIAQDKEKIGILIQRLSDFFITRKCTIVLYTVKQLGVIDLCGILPEQPGPLVSERNSYNISFIITGPVGQVAKDMVADFDKKLYVEVYDLCEYVAPDSVFHGEPDVPGQTTLFPEDVLREVTNDENL